MPVPGWKARKGLDLTRARATISVMRFALLFLALATPVLADTSCPAAPDHEAAKDEIYQLLRRAEDEGSARAMNGLLWEYWLDAPDEAAQELLDRGMARREVADYAGSVTILDELVAYCPDYADGYNQRAFANFLARDYVAALSDLERAEALDPRHLGVLTGQVLTLMGLERHEEAQVVLRRALRLNPWLGERHLLDGPPEVEL